MEIITRGLFRKEVRTLAAANCFNVQEQWKLDHGCFLGTGLQHHSPLNGKRFQRDWLRYQISFAEMNVALRDLPRAMKRTKASSIRTAASPLAAPPALLQNKCRSGQVPFKIGEHCLSHLHWPRKNFRWN
ncbi:hypothetical protein K443DRAFT_673452 [Laccaria amethystina LaAM-08-1]|uniref:Uncharacterized protein n=1 Tax=Laccaria amethystina LaAM-08-1 TaxID=1095629 RepID=A0A0C9YHT1_9AGAR|nr:hypothetical protein K443DRAFT_673452 [Laccaria amethystina LaAM-08-1]